MSLTKSNNAIVRIKNVGHCLANEEKQESRENGNKIVILKNLQNATTVDIKIDKFGSGKAEIIFLI